MFYSHMQSVLTCALAKLSVEQTSVMRTRSAELTKKMGLSYIDTNIYVGTGK